MITVSPGHFGPGTGAADIVDEVTEAIKVATKVTSLLNAADIVTTYIQDKTSKNKNTNINWLVAQHNKTSRKLDVSIHFNKVGARTKAPIGVEVLYMGDANKALASRVSAAISKASGLKNRGAKKRTDLGLLRGTNKPCILIEVCFVESVADVALYQAKFDEICLAIAKELAAYVGKSFVVPQTPIKPAVPSKPHRVKTGAFKSEAEAKKAQELMSQYGIASAKWSNIVRDGSAWRIITGTYASKQAAEDAIKKMQEKGILKVAYTVG